MRQQSLKTTPSASAPEAQRRKRVSVQTLRRRGKAQKSPQRSSLQPSRDGKRSSLKLAFSQVIPLIRMRDAAVFVGDVALYAIRQVCHLTVLIDVLQFMLRRVFSVLQWLNEYPARLQFRRTTRRFLSVMNTTESYTTFVEAAASLDHYCGVANWAQDAPPFEHCNAVGLLVDATAAQHLVQTGNVFGMETFLRLLLKRSAHGLMDASIYRYFHTAPHCITDYTDSIEALITAYAAASSPSGGESLPREGGTTSDRRGPPLNASITPMRELRPCWVRFEASTTDARSGLSWGLFQRGRDVAVAPSTNVSALPTFDLTAKISQVWRTLLRDTVEGSSFAFGASMTASGRRYSVPTMSPFNADESSPIDLQPMKINTENVPVPSSLAAAADTCNPLEGAEALPLGNSSLAGMGRSAAVETREAGELPSEPPRCSPPPRIRGAGSPVPFSTSSPSFPSMARATPPPTSSSPEVAVARHIQAACASLFRLTDGFAAPPAPECVSSRTAPTRLTLRQSPLGSASHRLGVLREALRSFGRTALVLSGGSSMGTYHAGVVRALHEAGVLPNILCGSSAGSMIAAMICTKSPDDLHAFMQSAVLSTEAIHMSPFGEDSGILGKLKRFFKTGFLMDVRSLMEYMRGQCGDMTFLEAYRLSGKVLNVSVTRSQQEGTPSDRHALLNYITAPDVVIWSAVSASCALPGLFTAVQLIEKPSLGAGTFAPYRPGELWCDGSVAQDIPRPFLIQLFGVNYLIVSQVNPFVIPFFRPPESYHITATSLPLLAQLWFLWVAVCSRVLTLLFSLHILPRTGGFEVFFLAYAQFYGGDLTIQPIESVLTAVPDYLNLVNNPSADYISYVASRAQTRTWPLVIRIRVATCVENCLLREIGRLEQLSLKEQMW